MTPSDARPHCTPHPLFPQCTTHSPEQHPPPTTCSKTAQCAGQVHLHPRRIPRHPSLQPSIVCVTRVDHLEPHITWPPFCTRHAPRYYRPLLRPCTAQYVLHTRGTSSASFRATMHRPHQQYSGPRGLGSSLYAPLTSGAPAIWSSQTYTGPQTPISALSQLPVLAGLCPSRVKRIPSHRLQCATSQRQLVLVCCSCSRCRGPRGLIVISADGLCGLCARAGLGLAGGAVQPVKVAGDVKPEEAPVAKNHLTPNGPRQCVLFQEPVFAPDNLGWGSLCTCCRTMCALSLCRPACPAACSLDAAVPPTCCPTLPRPPPAGATRPSHPSTRPPHTHANNPATRRPHAGGRPRHTTAAPRTPDQRCSGRVHRMVRVLPHGWRVLSSPLRERQQCRCCTPD